VADIPPSTPLLNRGPEALQDVLNGLPGEAEAQIRLLTRTEMRALVGASNLLGDLGRKVLRATWPGADRG
jgi:hypothetical protein